MLNFKICQIYFYFLTTTLSFFTIPMSIIEMKFNGIYWARIHLTENSCRSIHSFRSQKFISNFIGRTRKVNNTLYSCLYNKLGTFIAGCHRGIECCSLHISAHRVQYGICLCMNNISMFRVIETQKISLFIPSTSLWKFIIRAATRETIISDTNDAVVGIDDAGTNFSARVLASLSREKS